MHYSVGMFEAEWLHISQKQSLQPGCIAPTFFPSQINSGAWLSFLILLCSRCQYWTECVPLTEPCHKTHLFFDLSHSAYFFYATATVASFLGRLGPRPASRRLQYASDRKLGEGLGTRLEQPYCPHPYLVSQARPTSARNVIKRSGSNHRMSNCLFCSVIGLQHFCSEYKRAI